MSVLKTLSLSNLFMFDWNYHKFDQGVLRYTLKHI